eukprot:gene988-1934_t
MIIGRLSISTKFCSYGLVALFKMNKIIARKYTQTKNRKIPVSSMPLKGIPDTITPELLYAIARMGHGDSLVIADSNFPSDSIALNCTVNTPIRIHGSTSKILNDILILFPLDTYAENAVIVMDRVQSDKDKNLDVPAYSALKESAHCDLHFMERFEFYEAAKKTFCVIQTNDSALYANVIIFKGVL